MLQIMSPAGVGSNSVHDEWSYFLRMGRAVYPFIYQPCELSFRLWRRQYGTTTGALRNDVARVLDVRCERTPQIKTATNLTAR